MSRDSGATSLLAISEWAADAPQSVLAAPCGLLDVLTRHHPVPDGASPCSEKASAAAWRSFSTLRRASARSGGRWGASGTVLTSP